MHYSRTITILFVFGIVLLINLCMHIFISLHVLVLDKRQTFSYSTLNFPYFFFIKSQKYINPFSFE